MPSYIGDEAEVVPPAGQDVVGHGVEEEGLVLGDEGAGWCVWLWV
jgi:hypothetical protein